MFKVGSSFSRGRLLERYKNGALDLRWPHCPYVPITLPCFGWYCGTLNLASVSKHGRTHGAYNWSVGFTQIPSRSFGEGDSEHHVPLEKGLDDVLRTWSPFLVWIKLAKGFQSTKVCFLLVPYTKVISVQNLIGGMMLGWWTLSKSMCTYCVRF